MNKIDLEKEVEKINWWHRIDLGSGIITPGIDATPEKLENLGIPDNLQGMTVLDIGAWDGFFSFEAERRGASRVIATDSFCWGGEGWGTKAGFDLARRVLNSKVEDLEIDVLDLSPEKVGVFDLVLFLGVFYHMRHPLLALERIFSVTGNQLILETQVDMLWCERPVMAFYPENELNNDQTNWFGPNPPAVEAMLKAVGFRKIQMLSEQYDRTKFEEPLSNTIPQIRMVFHAWR